MYVKTRTSHKLASMAPAAKTKRAANSMKKARERCCSRALVFRAVKKCTGLKTRRYNGDALVNVVLLPVEGGVGLDDYVFVRGLLEFVHEHGLAGF